MDVASKPTGGQAGASNATDGSLGYPQLTGSYSADCEGFTQKLRDCGLISEGPFSCAQPENDEQECAFECLSIASCTILAQARCEQSAAPALDQCLSSCAGSFTCDSGSSIPEDYVCDSYPDCEDGSDEADCDFECGSGEVLPAFFQCDFEVDCEDGSDEVDCGGFECASGESVPESWQCDLEEDCADGSDELGCDFFVCQATGQRILSAWQCDQEEDCLDGSDEFGCARAICR